MPVGQPNGTSSTLGTGETCAGKMAKRDAVGCRRKSKKAATESEAREARGIKPLPGKMKEASRKRQPSPGTGNSDEIG